MSKRYRMEHYNSWLTKRGKGSLLPFPQDDLQTSGDYVALGAGSKLFAVFLTYPYQVIRSRMQQRPNERGMANYTKGWQTFKDTLRYEGGKGLYRGIVPNLLRVVPSSSITFLVYETVLKLLK